MSFSSQTAESDDRRAAQTRWLRAVGFGFALYACGGFLVGKPVEDASRSVWIWQYGFVQAAVFVLGLVLLPRVASLSPAQAGVSVPQGPWLWLTLRGTILVLCGYLAILAVQQNVFGLVPAKHPVFHRLPVADGPELFGLLAVALLAAPLVEEWLFRGLLHGLFRLHMPRTAAILAGAAAFGFLHGDAAWWLPIGYCGACLAWLREQSGSLLPGLVVHILVNGFWTACALLSLWPAAG